MRNILLIVCFLAVLFSACEPMETRVELKSALSKSDVKFKVSQKVGKDNVVYIESLSPDVIPFWDLGIGISNKVKDTTFFAFGGKHIIKFWGYTAGGPVADSTEITVSKNDDDYFSDPAWNQISNGQTGRTWVWAFDNPYTAKGPNGNSICNGVGGYNKDVWTIDTGLDWWKNEGPEPGEITFDLNGAANFTKKLANGKVIKGFYDFERIGTDSKNLYLVLKAGASPLNADGDKWFNDRFRIWKITNDELIFIQIHSWGQRPFYMKRKGFSYNNAK